MCENCKPSPFTKHMKSVPLSEAYEFYQFGVFTAEERVRVWSFPAGQISCISVCSDRGCLLSLNIYSSSQTRCISCVLIDCTCSFSHIKSALSTSYTRARASFFSKGFLDVRAVHSAGMVLIVQLETLPSSLLQLPSRELESLGPHSLYSGLSLPVHYVFPSGPSPGQRFIVRIELSHSFNLNIFSLCSSLQTEHGCPTHVKHALTQYIEY